MHLQSTSNIRGEFHEENIIITRKAGWKFYGRTQGNILPVRFQSNQITITFWWKIVKRIHIDLGS
jgi:hypothetical protein